MDFSNYRLRDLSEIEEIKKEMGSEGFYKYGIDIYKYFANMKKGDTFDVTKKVLRKNVSNFIKIICLYVSDFPGEIQVNETFTEIEKL